ncbi:hypothetical protein NEMBOFW57_009704 [Staphylotrichum longicolle]|uniref:Multicopper oxidase n=1 Tax=Staphylotrichum longicolle TaxID=669026 RepID=A0AAD4EPV2_9PEZI|nr:hypothetical protein NEMBOFW57_009704 [Staphylotrichum longicolle]
MVPSVFTSLAYLTLAGFARAATVTYNFNATWVWASPDGVGRPVIGINGEWPCPTIKATTGDIVVVNLYNGLGNQTTGLHFHGVNQIMTSDMDGPSGVTQCPLPPGSSMKYQFVVDSPGTFWYHSHNMGQYPDGLRGPMIVSDPNDPYKGQYDEEYVLTVSDWYHNDSITLMKSMLSPSNTNFLPAFPDSILVNEGKGARVNFVKGKTYRIRMINFSAFASALIHFDSHTMSVISNDAAYIQKQEAYQLRLTPAQRYDVLISCIDRDNGNFPFLISLDINRDWTDPNAQLRWGLNYTGYLVMDSSPLTKLDVVDKWNPADDAHFKPYNNAPAYPSYDHLIHLDFEFCFDQNGYPRACFNNVTYIEQKVPTLYSAATTGQFNTKPHHLRPTGRATGPAATSTTQQPADARHVAVMAHSYAVLRFKADNPGVWLFHCHIEWHVEMGLTATIIEAPDRLRG